MIRSCLLAAALLAPLPASADALQDRIVIAARTVGADAYAFQQTITVRGTGVGSKVYVERFDPRRPAADRWALVSVDGRAPTAKETERSRKAKRGPVPSYGDLAKWFGAPATRSDGPPGYVTYRFVRLPAGTVKIGSHDASADTMVEALVRTGAAVPYVERVRYASTKGFRMMLVASVASMTATNSFRALADGQIVPAEMTALMSGSVMGKSGEIATRAIYSDFQKLR